MPRTRDASGADRRDATGCTIWSNGWRDGCLLTQDRVGSGLLRITHDFLATMLGTDRPSVSLAAGALQKKKIIEYTHGAVRVLNRKNLRVRHANAMA